MRIRIPYVYLLIVPYLCLAFGAGLNWLAVGANHGYMPVQGYIECAKQPVQGAGPLAQMFGPVEPDTDPIHVCMNKNTHLKVLCDWLLIPSVGTASIGDLFEWAYEKTFWPFIYMWFALAIKKFNE